MRLLACVAAGMLLATVPVLAQDDAPVEKAPGSKAARLFEKNCASCHAVPDTTLRTDRAWLDQVNRTS